jgi:hypothetical protein
MPSFYHAEGGTLAMAKTRNKLTDKEWKEEILKIVKDLRQVRKALEDEPDGLRKYLSPDDPPPRNTPGAGALPVPREELKAAVSSVRFAQRGKRPS